MWHREIDGKKHQKRCNLRLHTDDHCIKKSVWKYLPIPREMLASGGGGYILCTGWNGGVVLLSRSVVASSLRHHGLKPTRLLCPWHFPGRNTGVGCHGLLQESFPTQGSNPNLLCHIHCQWILYRGATGEVPLGGMKSGK